ncbi:MAG: response regulator, partial [Myxococcales bacterium]|nr:response regulator [Myxococcales bacterium]
MSTQSENEPRSGAAGGATRVLLVEDEDALRRAYMRILTGHDLAVRDAGSALAALALLETETFDVVVSDIRMPDMDGIELLRAIRARSFDLPVILITGSPSIETAMQAVEFGALRYLTKPVTSGALIDAIEHGERLHRMARLKHQAAAEVGGEKPQPGDLASVEAGFRRALDSLWIAYQPIVSWSQRQIVAYEGLVRTKEPSIPHPGALFAAAERLDRLYELGRAIRAHIAETLDHGTTGCETYVNLHPRDLNDETLFESASPLARHAARIVLEITERAT